MKKSMAVIVWFLQEVAALRSVENMSDEVSSEEDHKNYSKIRRGVERLNSNCTLRNRRSHHYKKHYTGAEVCKQLFRSFLFSLTDNWLRSSCKPHKFWNEQMSRK